MCVNQVVLQSMLESYFFTQVVAEIQVYIEVLLFVNVKLW